MTVSRTRAEATSQLTQLALEGTHFGHPELADAALRALTQLSMGAAAVTVGHMEFRIHE